MSLKVLFYVHVFLKDIQQQDFSLPPYFPDGLLTLFNLSL